MPVPCCTYRSTLTSISEYSSIAARDSCSKRGLDSAECGGHQAYKREEIVARDSCSKRGLDSAECGGHQAYKGGSI
ncbi:uncharacterized protein N7483_011263 [Penicillium malachiteum]|uniref:uncharacterized protein n=1 Tax=Penicillium malachiteum TaxID=1324776 RepID=UPI0025472DE5|nr:uncharacterized protein N7483_011263 [Penicillium malachiteum]KAJ5714082.1 hypothetical protein N7483_011263 [Penicillium malachiteum]